MVEGEEAIAVGRVDHSLQVLVVDDLVAETTLHTQRVQQQIDLTIGQGEHRSFLSAIERVLEAGCERTDLIGHSTGLDDRSGVVVVGVRRAGGEAPLLDLTEHGGTCGRRPDTRGRDQRVTLPGGLCDHLAPEVLWKDRHVRRSVADAPSGETGLAVVGDLDGQVVDRLDCDDTRCLVVADIEIVGPVGGQTEVAGRLEREHVVVRGDRLTIGPGQVITQRDGSDPVVTILHRRLQIPCRHVGRRVETGIVDGVGSAQGWAKDVADPDVATRAVQIRPRVVRGHILEDAQGIDVQIASCAIVIVITHRGIWRVVSNGGGDTVAGGCGGLVRGIGASRHDHGEYGEERK